MVSPRRVAGTSSTLFPPLNPLQETNPLSPLARLLIRPTSFPRPAVTKNATKAIGKGSRRPKRLRRVRCASPPPHGAAVNGRNGSGGAGGRGGRGGGGDSSDSSTPKDRSHIGSSDDLTKFASGAGGAGGGGGGGDGSGGGSHSAGNGNSYRLHHQSLTQQLAKLQQQHQLAAIQQARMRQRFGGGFPQHHSQLAPHLSHSSHASRSAHQNRPQALDLQTYRGLNHSHSAQASREASPISEDSDDDELVDINHAPPSPVLTSLQAMTLLHRSGYVQGLGRGSMTAPVSISTSPLHSRNPSRASSPVEGGHSATSGRHGYGSHYNRDAKKSSHPYSHLSQPTTPYFPSSNKGRMSPPPTYLHRTLSGGSHRQPGPSGIHQSRPTVEDILNSSRIPPPPAHSDRKLPLPTSTTFSTSLPSVSYSLSSQSNSTRVSPVTSRASSPVHSSLLSHGNGNASHQVHAHSHLAHGVRAAFDMTPISRSTSRQSPGSYPSSGGSASPKFSPPMKLPPLSVGGTPGKVLLPSFSRGASPMRMGAMEVDGQA